MDELGIYVHLPFCKRKCKYCDFISFDKYDCDVQGKYVNALIQEIENSKITNRINTIYIGGGTPSLISSDFIEKILNKIYEKFEISEDIEITIEINPGTVDEEKLEKYKEIGINRLSIGLQSTNDRLLKILGRIHTFSEFLSCYKIARECGFSNINVDLMLALPTQTLEELEESLEKIIELKPEHISLYSLILEENTEFKKLFDSGKLELPNEDLEREMYWETKKILEKNGYNHYEISNFSKSNFQSKHNMNCWNQEEYIGFGLAAHSYINKKRFANINNIEEYIKNIENKNYQKNIILHEEQNFENQAKEYMMLNLRKLEGISISKFEQKFQIHPLFYFRFEISKLEEEDLIEVDLDKIKLTKKGLDFANKVFEEFV